MFIKKNLEFSPPSCGILFAKEEFEAVWAVSELGVWAVRAPAAVGVAMEQAGCRLQSVLGWCWGTSAGQWTEALHCPPGHALCFLGAKTCAQEGSKVCLTLVSHDKISHFCEARASLDVWFLPWTKKFQPSEMGLHSFWFGSFFQM